MRIDADVSGQSTNREPLLPSQPMRTRGIWPLVSANRNIACAWVLTFLSSAADAIWHGTVLTAFLFMKYSGNCSVSYLDATRCIFKILIAYPIGWLADRWSNKSGLIAAGAILVLPATISTALAIQREDDSYEMLVVSLCGFSIVYAICKGPVDALYASSMSIGERSKYYTRKFQIEQVAETLGRLTTIAVFFGCGDIWDVSVLSSLIYAGLALEVLSGGMMLCFRNSAILPASHDVVRPPERLARYSGEGLLGKSMPASHPHAPHDPPHPRAWMVPGTLFVASALFGLGSGMTVKFVPLFLKEDLHLSPTGVQLTYAALPTVIGATSGLGQRLGRTYGRVQTMLGLRMVSVALLLGVGAISSRVHAAALSARGAGAVAAPPAQHAALVPMTVLLYVARTALANCTQPLSTSISMDFVARDVRARWASLNSVVQALWSASAAAGGVLADKQGYASAFVVTAGFHVAGALVQASLLPIVPKHE